MALKAFNSQGRTYANTSLRALEYAMDNGAKISNHSYGSPYSSAAEESLIEEAADQGHVLVVAAGNAGSNNDIAGMFPASYPSGNIISVAALDQTGSLAGFSNYGSVSVDIAAPGRDILSTLPGGTYGYMSGTSMAAPHVTGLVALLRTLNPGISPDTIRETLINAARPDDRLGNLSVSGGSIDAQATLQMTSSAPTTTTTTTTVAPTTTTTAAPAETTTTTAAPAETTTTTAAPAETTTTTAVPTTTTTTAAPTTTAAAAQTDPFGTGTWRVGEDVASGTWRTTGVENCVWKRLSGFSGASSDTIEWGVYVDGNVIVEISPTDVGFSSDDDCGTWSPL
jgi:subtilisin family serine protease